MSALQREALDELERIARRDAQGARAAMDHPMRGGGKIGRRKPHLGQTGDKGRAMIPSTA